MSNELTTINDSPLQAIRTTRVAMANNPAVMAALDAVEKAVFLSSTAKTFAEYNANELALELRKALLLIFRGITLPKWVKTAVKILSPAAFGVYITHMHPEIWNRVIVGKFGSLGADNPLLMVLEVLGAVLILYLGFSVIDLVRGWIFKLLKVKERLTALEIKLRNRKAEKAE